MRIWNMRIFPSLKKRICQGPAVQAECLGYVLILTLIIRFLTESPLVYIVAQCTYILGPTHLLISEIFPSKPDFHL